MDNIQQQTERSESSSLEDLIKEFQPGSEYQVMRIIGQGLYTDVYTCKHLPSNVEVAIKKIDHLESSILCKHALSEIKLLKNFDHENIIAIFDMVKPPSQHNFAELYVVQELMDIDLCRLIKTQTFSEEHLQYFLYQILRALKYIHSCDVIHRNLTPKNILINADSCLRVSGLGLACSSKKESFLTRYVEELKYRAPEALLSYEASSKAMDIWSVGCIFAEMLNKEQSFFTYGYRIFLKQVCDLLGTPSPQDYQRIVNKDEANFIRSLPPNEKGNLKEQFSTASPEALDLLEKMLVFNPEKRITAEEALEHPFLAQYHDADDEPCGEPLDPDFFNFDSPNKDLSSKELKVLIWQEIQNIPEESADE